LILGKLNSWRSLVAGGKYRLPPASRMGRVLWDTELASLAAYSAIDCSGKVDSCRSTSKFPFPGQTVGVEMWAIETKYPTDIIVKIIDLWMDSERLLTRRDVRSYNLTLKWV